MDLDIPSYRSKAILEAATLPFVDVSTGSPDEAPKEEPIAAQIWKMYTKQKDALPNGARMENLSWRMVSKASESDTVVRVAQPLDGHEFEEEGG